MALLPPITLFCPIIVLVLVYEHLASWNPLTERVFEHLLQLPLRCARDPLLLVAILLDFPGEVIDWTKGYYVRREYIPRFLLLCILLAAVGAWLARPQFWLPLIGFAFPPVGVYLAFRLDPTVPTHLNTMNPAVVTLAVSGASLLLGCVIVACCCFDIWREKRKLINFQPCELCGAITEKIVVKHERHVYWETPSPDWDVEHVHIEEEGYYQCPLCLNRRYYHYPYRC